MNKIRRHRIQQLQNRIDQQEDSEPLSNPLNNTEQQRDSSESPDSSRSHSSEQSSRNRSFSSRGSGRNPRQPVERRDVGSDTGSGQSHGLAALFARLRRERGEDRPTGVARHFQGDTESEDHELSDYLTSDEFNAIQKVEWGGEQARRFDVDSACKICYYPFVYQEEVCVVPVCHHLMHSRCLETWTKRNRSCPECHEPIFI